MPHIKLGAHVAGSTVICSWRHFAVQAPATRTPGRPASLLRAGWTSSERTPWTPAGMAWVMMGALVSGLHTGTSWNQERPGHLAAQAARVSRCCLALSTFGMDLGHASADGAGTVPRGHLDEVGAGGRGEPLAGTTTPHERVGPCFAGVIAADRGDLAAGDVEDVSGDVVVGDE